MTNFKTAKTIAEEKANKIREWIFSSRPMAADTIEQAIIEAISEAFEETNLPKVDLQKIVNPTDSGAGGSLEIPSNVSVEAVVNSTEGWNRYHDRLLTNQSKFLGKDK